jgi:hypothetical protein
MTKLGSAGRRHPADDPVARRPARCVRATDDRPAYGRALCATRARGPGVCARSRRPGAFPCGAQHDHHAAPQSIYPVRPSTGSKRAVEECDQAFDDHLRQRPGPRTPPAS